MRKPKVYSVGSVGKVEELLEPAERELARSFCELTDLGERGSWSLSGLGFILYHSLGQGSPLRLKWIPIQFFWTTIARLQVGHSRHAMLLPPWASCRGR